MDLSSTIFFAGCGVGIPLAVFLGCKRKEFLYLFFGFLVLSTLFPRLSITFVSREWYKIATRGFEIHLMDVLAIVLMISMFLRPKDYTLRFWVPLLIPCALYLFVSIVSWAVMEQTSMVNTFFLDEEGELARYELGLFPLFEIVKIMRGFFVYLVCLNFVNDRKSFKVLVSVCVVIVLYCTVDAVFSRYALGEYRVSIPGFHVNTFNVYIGMLGLFLFPFALSKKNSLGKSVFFWFLIACVLVAIILTVSRSSLAGFVFGGAIVYLLCFIRMPLYRTILLTVCMACAGLVIAAKSVDTLLGRFTTELHTSSMEHRGELNQSAVLMANDHLFGVGLGNYKAHHADRYADIMGVKSGNIAHNIWYLTLAEVGYPGLLAFLLIWLRFYQVIFSGIWRAWRDARETPFLLLVGVLGASLTLQFQVLFHFSYRTSSVHFLLQIFTAVAVRCYLDQIGTFPFREEEEPFERLSTEMEEGACVSG